MEGGATLVGDFYDQRCSEGMEGKEGGEGGESHPTRNKILNI